MLNLTEEKRNLLPRMFDEILTVSQASDVINETLHAAVPVLLVEGEVSGFTINRGKFIFFDVKDDESSLSCFMMAFALKFPLEDGMKVRLLVEPTLTNKGRFSLTVRELQPIGEGSLKKAFDILKKKLEAEGLFDDSRKRILPLFPTRIAVVSSCGAAGWADFSKIIDARWGGLRIELADVGVQGLNAPAEIVSAIQWLNQQAEPADILVVIRGGGSADDLAAFNHEDVVRAVAGSRIPTVVGIGHEVDTSLAELVADVRASTPSNAAQLVVPDRVDYLSKVQKNRYYLEESLTRFITRQTEDVDDFKLLLHERTERYFSHTHERIAGLIRVIEQLSPQAALKRGYGLIRSKQGVVSRISDVTIGDKISIELKDGRLGAIVDEKQ